MLIGELSKRTGLTRDAIRFYEKQGLIKLKRSDRRVNNYKEYSEDTLRRLLLVKKIKSYGFTLSESGEIINLIDARLDSCATIAEIANEKITQIDAKINELAALRGLLKNSITGCCTGNTKSLSETKCALFDIND